MDINNDLQQINTFVKGMNTDVSDALMDSSQYRYAENVRLTTNTDENTGELRLIEGTSAYSNLSDYGDIMAMTSIRNMLVVVTLKNVNGRTKNFIIKKEIGTDSNFKSVFLSDPEEDDPFGLNLSLVTRWENSNDVKLYIADGKHNLMYVNLRLQNGEIIQKISDIVSVVYEPLENPHGEVSENSGTLPPAKLQYTYRRYKEGGSATTLSPFSNVIVLYNGDKGYSEQVEEGVNAVDLTIPAYGQDSDLDKMQIFRISYRLVGQIPTVELIYDDVYRSSYTDSGRTIQTQSFEELLALMQAPIVPNVIESKNDYLFAANFSYNQDDVDERLKDLNFRIYSTGDYDLQGRERDYNILFDNYKTYNESNWYKQDTNTIGGIGRYIDWEIIKNPIYIDDENRKYKNYSNGIASEQINYLLNSLRQGEVYRYGAVLYDEKGLKSSVQWLCDIMAPIEMYEILGTNSNRICKVILVGVRFTIHDLPAGFTGAEIVRAPRRQSDKIRLLQGIAGFPYHLEKRFKLEDDFQDANALCTPYLISTDQFSFPGDLNPNDKHTGGYHSEYALSLAYSDNSKLVLACPEYAYQRDDTNDILKNLSLDVNISHTLQIPLSYHLIDCTHGTSNHGFIGRVDYGDGNYSEWTPGPAVTDYFNAYRVINYKDENDSRSNFWLYINGKYVYNGRCQAYNIWKGSYDGHPWKHPEFSYISPNDIHNVSFYHIYPQNIQLKTNTSNVGIADVAYSSIDLDDASDKPVENKTAHFTSSTSIGGVLYIKWAIPLMYNQRSKNVELQWADMDPSDEDYFDDIYRLNANNVEALDRIQGYGPVFSPVGSTGRYILLSLDGIIDFSTPVTNSTDDLYITCPVVNIIKKSPLPYGGPTSYSNQDYVLSGSYKKYNGSSVTLDVFDGDCYPGIFVFNAVHAWYDYTIITGSNLFNGIRQSCVYYVPLESDIDLSATYGDLYTRLEANRYYMQDQPKSFDGFVLQKEAYMYNTAYSYKPENIQYSAVSYSSVSSNEYDCRVCHSNLKTNGESIDSWLFFSPNNYIDVDTRFGKITNMRLFKDKLLFWQEHAVGVLSVNERTVLNDLENNDIVVGTGGTLQRYDYISTVYGMKKNQYNAETQSNVAQYWWDGYNKEILAYGGGMELVPLTKVKGCTNYINEREESNRPMLAYDTKYDEVLAQVVDDDTLVYNEQIQAFSSLYTFNPTYKAVVSTELYLADISTSIVYINNKLQEENYSILFGQPAFPKVRIVVNKNNIYTKTFDNLTFGGRIYKGSLPTIVNWSMDRVPGEYIKEEHLNSPMHHLIFTFETPLKQKSVARGNKVTSVDEYDYRLAIPRNGSLNQDIEYGNRMRGKTMQCEIASDYNSTDFSLQYITTKFRMSWS